MGIYIVENNIELPSVTTILKLLDKSDALMVWALNECEKKLERELSFHTEPLHTGTVYELFKSCKFAFKEISDKALDIGTEVHGLIEIFIKEAIKGNIILLKDDKFKNESIFNGYKAFIDWQTENIKEWLETEKTVYSLQYGYAGTLDAKALFNDDKIRIIDFKTSKAIYDDNIMQIAAYKYAEDELNKFQPISNGMGILRLDKETGLPEWKDFSDKFARSFNAFTTLTVFYYLQKNRRLKNNPFVDKIKALYK